MEDAIDLELGEDAIEQALIEDRAAELALHEPREFGAEGIHVESDNRPRGVRGELRDQPVADFSVGAGDENDGTTNHARAAGVGALSSRASSCSRRVTSVSSSVTTARTVSGCDRSTPAPFSSVIG